MGQWLPGKHICVVGTARPEQRNPIYLTHELIVLILVVERETGVIVGCDINMVCSLTREFIKSVFEGKNLVRDIEEIRECIQENYFGASAKTLVMAARSALNEAVRLSGKPGNMNISSLLWGQKLTCPFDSFSSGTHWS